MNQLKLVLLFLSLSILILYAKAGKAKNLSASELRFLMSVGQKNKSSGDPLFEEKIDGVRNTQTYIYCCKDVSNKYKQMAIDAVSPNPEDSTLYKLYDVDSNGDYSQNLAYYNESNCQYENIVANSNLGHTGGHCNWALTCKLPECDPTVEEANGRFIYHIYFRHVITTLKKEDGDVYKYRHDQRILVKHDATDGWKHDVFNVEDYDTEKQKTYQHDNSKLGIMAFKLENFLNFF